MRVNRPIRRRQRPKRYSEPRHVNEEPLVPGLRDREPAEAIGFVHDFGGDDDDE